MRTHVEPTSRPPDRAASRERPWQTSEAVLALQRTAGNAAVTRALVQRAYEPGWTMFSATHGSGPVKVDLDLLSAIGGKLAALVDIPKEGPDYVPLSELVGPNDLSGEEELAIVGKRLDEEMTEYAAQQLQEIRQRAKWLVGQKVQVLNSVPSHTGLKSGEICTVVSMADDDLTYPLIEVDVIDATPARRHTVACNFVGTLDEMAQMTQEKEERKVTKQPLADHEVSSTLMLSGVVGQSVMDKSDVAVEGNLKILPDDEFVATFCSIENKPPMAAEGVNGFAHQGVAYVRESHHGLGTEIHEALHLYSSNKLRAVGFHINEGVTEYFTRLVCQEIKLPAARQEYESQHSHVRTLVSNDVLTRQQLIRIYFKGMINEFSTAIRSWADESFSFPQYLAAVEAKKFVEAEEYLVKHRRGGGGSKFEEEP